MLPNKPGQLVRPLITQYKGKEGVIKSVHTNPNGTVFYMVEFDDGMIMSFTEKELKITNYTKD